MPHLLLLGLVTKIVQKLLSEFCWRAQMNQNQKN